MQRKHVIVFLTAIIALGFLARVAAFQWNWFMHGDVTGDTSAVTGIHRDGRIVAFRSQPTADPAAYPLPPPEEGEPLVQHAPLWAILGAALTMVRGGEPTMVDAFLSLRYLSLIAGTFLIFLVFLVGSRLVGSMAGLTAAAWVAASYVLIDFAGNGAFYSLHAVLYLLFVLVALDASSTRRTIVLGVLAGIGYLVNYQAVILVPAGLAVLLMQERPWKRCVLHAALLSIVAILIVSPLLIRNTLLFGDPLYHQAWNMRYVQGKSGFHPADGEVLRLGLRDNLSILAGVFHTWLPYNLYYAARKLFVIAPFAFFLFCFGLIDTVFSAPRLRKTFPVLAILVFHALLSASWPIWKFRFFVPILPLVFLLAAEELWHLPLSNAWRRLCIVVTFVFLFAGSVLTYIATPNHATYYDGAITQDAFHGSEEKTYLIRYAVPPR
jgi:hypothetical protein